jgi:hypothetical protein
MSTKYGIYVYMYVALSSLVQRKIKTRRIAICVTGTVYLSEAHDFSRF